MEKILVTGACGQIGTELVELLRQRHGAGNVVAAGHRTSPCREMLESGPFEFVDATDGKALGDLVGRHGIKAIHHLGAVLSAKGEQNPDLAFRVNLIGLYTVLEVSRERNVRQVNVPSSIAAFGPETPRDGTPNETVMRPTTMYGITKVAGELLGNYYVRKYGLDVRGVRLPGIISYKTLPGGGTTDYAVEIFHAALKGGRYTCFVREDTVLPMMYMPDALKAMTDLADAEFSRLRHHCDYNVAAMSFSAGQLAAAIREHMPGFACDYRPDFRQEIADSWPRSLDDSAAREEWGWKPEYDLAAMVRDMLSHLK